MAWQESANIRKQDKIAFPGFYLDTFYAEFLLHPDRPVPFKQYQQRRFMV
jgi:hypothetical protein